MPRPDDAAAERAPASVDVDDACRDPGADGVGRPARPSGAELTAAGEFDPTGPTEIDSPGPAPGMEPGGSTGGLVDVPGGVVADDVTADPDIETGRPAAVLGTGGRGRVAAGCGAWESGGTAEELLGPPGPMGRAESALGLARDTSTGAATTVMARAAAPAAWAVNRRMVAPSGAERR